MSPYRSTKRKPKKVFTEGQTVKAQLRVGGPWETVTYVRASEARGWHRVRVVSLEDSLTTDDYVTSVPTQRLRAMRPLEAE